ncbi:hypothetical protein Tco_0593710 [Tanacetum coccineum]
MQVEIHEFGRLDVWELVPPLDRAMIIALKFIYKVKLDEYGDVLKNKTCLVAKGYRQEEGLDFEESFNCVILQCSLVSFGQKMWSTAVTPKNDPLYILFQQNPHMKLVHDSITDLSFIVYFGGSSATNKQQCRSCKWKLKQTLGSHSPSSSAHQSSSVHHGVATEHSFEVNPFAATEHEPFVNVFAPDPNSEASSSGTLTITTPN